MSTSPKIPTITIEQTNNISSVESLLMAPKRRREPLCSSEGALNKTPRLSHYDSPTRIIQLIDKRFDRQTELIKSLINESENRLLTVIDNSMSVFKREVANLSDRILNLSNRVEKVETVADKIECMKSDLETMKSEIENLKIEKQKHDNLHVASDLRINGVPFLDNENLYHVFDTLCNNLNIVTPTVKSIYRINHTQKIRDYPETIIVHLVSPNDKNYILKNIALFKKSNKTNMQLKHIGLNSDKPFYVNENLTTNNYKIFQNALKLKRQKCLESTFTLRGLVYVKRAREEPPIMVDSSDKLINLFRDVRDQNSTTAVLEQNSSSNNIS